MTELQQPFAPTFSDGDPKFPVRSAEHYSGSRKLLHVMPCWACSEASLSLPVIQMLCMVSVGCVFGCVTTYCMYLNNVVGLPSMTDMLKEVFHADKVVIDNNGARLTG